MCVRRMRVPIELVLPSIGGSENNIFCHIGYSKSWGEGIIFRHDAITHDHQVRPITQSPMMSSISDHRNYCCCHLSVAIMNWTTSYPYDWWRGGLRLVCDSSGLFDEGSTRDWSLLLTSIQQLQLSSISSFLSTLKHYLNGNSCPKAVSLFNVFHRRLPQHTPSLAGFNTQLDN
jgi:hypothetical protein